MYVVVRRDMPIGVQMAQACHAAFLFAQTYAHQTLDWHTHSQYLVIVSVEDQVELIRLGSEAIRVHAASGLHLRPLPGDLLALQRQLR
jgi:peptidyl-tRNA hydrolase